MWQYIKINLDTGLFNAGIVGLIKMLKKAEADYSEEEQCLSINKEFFLRDDLAEIYLDMIFEKYKDTDRFGKLIGIDFDTCDEKVLDSYTSLFKNKTAPNICETYEDTILVPLMDEYVRIPKNEVDEKRAKGNEIKEYLTSNEKLYRYVVIGHATREEFSEFFGSMAYLALSQGNNLLKKNTPFLEALNDFVFDKLTTFINSYQDFVGQNKYQCLQCRDISFPNKNLVIDMKFLNDFVDDPAKKQSPFWNFTSDSNLCPVCALVYMLMPFGFVDILGNSFKKDKLFINDNSSVSLMRKRNETYQEQEQGEEGQLNKYKVINAIIMEELKTRQEYELNNIELIVRENHDKRSFYSYSVLGKDILEIIKDSQNFLQFLVRKVKTNDDDYIDIFSEVLNNLVNNANQWSLMQKLLRLEDSVSPRYNNLLNNILKIQLKQNKSKEKGMKNEKRIVSAKMSGLTIKRYFGAEAENKLRSYIYKLINALGTGNRDMFLDSVTRMYSGINMEIPSVFFDVFASDEGFKEIGYAYILGLKGGEYSNKDNAKEQQQ